MPQSTSHGRHHSRASVGYMTRYLTDDLLELAEKNNIPKGAKKRILWDALAGLADLHERNILHGDIKPNNVFVDYNENPAGAIAVKQVQIGDLEMGSVIPPCLNVRGARLGNLMWRSPEAHAASHINLPSDMFSFGLVCINTILHKIIVRIDIEELNEAEEERLIVKRLLSHFGDGPGLVSLLEHLDDDEATSWRDSFSMWEDVDECFRDVITKVMSLDPARRIAAREALEHPWFHKMMLNYLDLCSRGPCLDSFRPRIEM